MSPQQIAEQRLLNQNLINPVATAGSVVGNLCCVQSQDFWGACWALSQRTGQTYAQIVKDFNDGKILRTHILRPTWHFVLPTDILWIQNLTGARVLKSVKSYYKKLDLGEDKLQKANKVLAQNLKNTALDRKQIKQVYEDAKIDTTGLKLGFLLMYAELTGLICSGPLKGKQHTYALISERAPQAKQLTTAQALLKLTETFFASHGPATIKDFNWWATLATSDIRAAIAKTDLKNTKIGDVEFYSKSLSDQKIKTPTIHLLPNYDEMIVPYKTRLAALGRDLKTSPSFEDLSYNFVTQNGQIIGGWRRQIKPGKIDVKLNLFKSLNSTEQAELNKALDDLAKFADAKINLI